MRTDHEVLLVVHRPGPEFLVLLRAPEGQGYWHLVSGGIEEGESPLEAARRELDEETGLRPATFEPISRELGYRQPGGTWITLHPFAVEAPPAWEPVLNEEHVDYRWCSEESALALLRYPEPRVALELVAQRLGAQA
jgi:dihydroneopterin triphosphate diphosphatase